MTMELIYSREPFDKIYDEILPLVEMHYEEIAWRKDKVPLVINRERYEMLAREGMLLCYTVRDYRSSLVGYAVFFLTPHLHYNQTNFAANDIIYLQPHLRGDGSGHELIRYCEKDLKALGAQVISWHVKPQIDFGPMLEVMEYTPQDRVWLKWIGD